MRDTPIGVADGMPLGLVSRPSRALARECRALLQRLAPGQIQDRYRLPRRGARVVDRGGLENRCTREGTVGSNPTPSAIDINLVP